MKTALTSWFTFGQEHVHSVDGRTYDKDVVVKITAYSPETPREIMFRYFGPKWSMEYSKEPNMTLFPRGIFEI